MRALVTGAAGFVGSHLCEALLAAGHGVRGVDAFTPCYERDAKEANLERARGDARFELVEADLAEADLAPLVDGVDVVFHQAAQPGVRRSWSDGFARYVQHNVLATQRLLEAVSPGAEAGTLRRVVYASSSSVYGNAPSYPTAETDLPRPHSPYGVTKLAAEHLCGLYAANRGVPTVSLRYFTVYGPGQRPDMAVHRFIERILDGEALPLFGTGAQVRDLTFVADVVAANLAAAEAEPAPGSVFNVAGGSSVTMADLIDLLRELAEREVHVERLPAQAGDVTVTQGATERAEEVLGWRPEVDLRTGLALQLEWHVARRQGAAGGRTP